MIKVLSEIRSYVVGKACVPTGIVIFPNTPIKIATDEFDDALDVCRASEAASSTLRASSTSA
jgi:hypothetical protein